MGVLRFFKHVMKKYKQQAITSILKKGERYIHLGYKNPNPDVLLIDCNAVFHPACRSVFDPSTESILRPSQLTPEQKKQKAFREVCKLLEKIIQVGQPQKVVYLAIDGVAGCCKQSQQRKRRFKTARDSIENPGSWDSSVLTVGTSFMTELSEHMRLHFSTTPLYNLQGHQLRVIFNSQNIPGEGEHKLVRFVENDRQYRSYCIYSPDADLIMLGMLLPKSYVTILRENIYQDQAADYFLVNIYHLKKEFLTEMQRLSVMMLIEPSQQLEAMNHFSYLDIVLFFFMLGNDFLPHVSCIDILSDGIDVLLQTYVMSVLKENHGPLVYSSGKLAYQFNMKSLLSLLDRLQDDEPGLLVQKSNKLRPPIPDTVLEQSMNDDKCSMDFMSYRSAYYIRNFGSDSDETIQEVCNEYLKGLIFVIQYYAKAIPTFEWFYPFHYSPLFYDLYMFVEKLVSEGRQLEYIFEFKPPLTQIEALASVLHPNSFDSIPHPQVREYMKTRALIDSSFPETFEVDLEGKMQEYEGIILLPMIPYETIRTILKKYKLRDPNDQIVDLVDRNRIRR